MPFHSNLASIECSNAVVQITTRDVIWINQNHGFIVAIYLIQINHSLTNHDEIQIICIILTDMCIYNTIFRGNITITKIEASLK